MRVFVYLVEERKLAAIRESKRTQLGLALANRLGLDGFTDGQLGRQAEVIANRPELALYSRDLAEIPGAMAALLLPHSTPHLALHATLTDEIATAVGWANEVGLPVVPRGLSSSAYGGGVPTRGGLLLDMAAFRTIWYLDEEKMTVRVQAGVSWGDLEKYLNARGLTVYTYPSSRFSTVGGWVATGGLGVNAFKYGHLKNWVTKLRVVHPSGEQADLLPGNPAFDAFFGTEGQMGVVTGVSLKVRSLPEFTMPHLYYLADAASVTTFVQHLIAQGVTPAHVKLLDSRQMANLNVLHREEHPERDGLVQEREAVFLHVDDAADEQALQAALVACPVGFEEAPRYVAGAVWHDRFFPMKLKRLGPSLLAAQVVLPVERAQAYVEEAAALGRRFGMTLATESYVVLTQAGGYEVLAMPMYPCDGRNLSYGLHLFLAQLLTWLGLQRGGQPYAAGLWNSPFVVEKYGADRYAELLAYKREVDAAGRFNPGKFEGARGVAGLLLHRGLFRVLMRVGLALSPVLGGLARLLYALRRQRPAVPKAHHYDTVALTPASLQETILACTGCGDCLPVCPAYLVTGDETVVGRAKLRAGLRALNSHAVGVEEAHKTFQCMYCKACQDVCQSNLPLIAAYEMIEDKLAERHGRPDALLETFIASAESRTDYFEFIGTHKFPAPEAELPFDVVKLAEQVSENGKPAPAAVLEPEDGTFTNGAEKYHIEVEPAPSRREPLGRFVIERADFCINCGQCMRACLYGVHERTAFDIRKMNQPDDHLCRACFRCVQECPQLALTISHSETFADVGAGIYTPDVIHSLATQSERGQIPVTGQGYRGKFSGPGFDGMWTDMSEIVRPTRDGIHGREFISTAVSLGTRPEKLTFGADGTLQTALPPVVDIQLPVLIDLTATPGTAGVALLVARNLGTLALLEAGADLDGDTVTQAGVYAASPGDVPDGVRLVIGQDEELARQIAASRPDAVVGMRLTLDKSSPQRVAALARAGVALVLLEGESGLDTDPTQAAPNITALLPLVHDRLIDEGLRDKITLVARGGIAQAEHLAKAMILGADALALDWPLLVAAECRLEGTCREGLHVCGLDERLLDEQWAAQRMTNLLASWHAQFLEVMGAMGLREARRLRGERGRAMFADHLEEKNFAGIIRISDIGVA